MFFYEVNLQVHREQHRDLLRIAEQQQLIRAARSQAGGRPKMHRRVVGWIGTRMVRVGTGLQQYANSPGMTAPAQLVDKG